MCTCCRETLAQIPTSKDHDVTPFDFKVEQINRDVKQQVMQARQSAAVMTSYVAQLQLDLEKLGAKQAQLLQECDELKTK